MKFLLALSLALAATTNANLTEQPKRQNDNEPVAISQPINSIAAVDEIENLENLIDLQPLPLLMPTFKIDEEGKVSIKNVFDLIEKEIQETQPNIGNENEEQMEIKKQNAQSDEKDEPYLEIELESVIGGKERNNLKYEITGSEQLFGEGDHDNWITKDMPLIGGDNHDTWIKEDNLLPPFIGGDPFLIGGDDHDLWNEEFKKNQPLIGGGDNDQWKQEIIKQILLIGNDGHENWKMQMQHPIVGGDDHDNWRLKRQQFENNQPLIGQEGNDEWKKKSDKIRKKHQKGNRKHSNFNKKHWEQNKQFTTEQIKPYLMTKLPDFKENSQIISIVNNGWEKRFGFHLAIKIINEKKENLQISAFFMPRIQEFLIDKIESITAIPWQSSSMIVPPATIDPLIIVQENQLPKEQEKVFEEVIKSTIEPVDEQKQQKKLSQAPIEDVEEMKENVEEMKENVGEMKKNADEKKEGQLVLSLEEKAVDVKRNLQSKQL